MGVTRRRLVVAATSSSSLSISEGNVLGFRDCFCFFWLCLSRKKLAPAKNLFCARHISFCAGVEGDRALIARQGDVRLRGWRIRSWAIRNLARGTCTTGRHPLLLSPVLSVSSLSPRPPDDVRPPRAVPVAHPGGAHRRRRATGRVIWGIPLLEALCKRVSTEA